MSVGNLIVVSGASGVGKGTVLKRVIAERDDLEFSVSATTRPPRPDEVHGTHYYFVSVEEFDRMIQEDAFLEYDIHSKASYGTPLEQLEEKLSRSNVILDIDPKGAEIVKAKRPDATLIFIMPPSMEELERRLRGRGDTPEDQIQMRLKRAVWEIDQRGWYNHVVVNDELDRCVKDVLKIIADTVD